MEFAIRRASGLVDDDTPTATTVHEIRVVDEAIPTTCPRTGWSRPTEPSTRTLGTKPIGSAWDDRGEERVEEMPGLGRPR